MKRVERVVFCAAVGLVGCHRAPAVATRESLPLRRVVIYRNGVGYFERHGRVDSEQVEFRVRQGDVGDFLATLAVMERGGSSVRSAAFPLPHDLDEGRPRPRPRDDRRVVRLRLDGRGHDLVVGYTIETPIWRPSYRLVFTRTGVQVQAWGVVQNLTGSDWTDVQLSLVSGSPVSFRSELADPVLVDRPVVTDRGEVIDAVPQADTTLAQEDERQVGGAPPPPAMAPAPQPVPDATGDYRGRAPRGGSGARGRAPAPPPRSAPSTETGNEARTGAERASDRDGDRIPDHRDRCPDQPETYNGRLDHDGCPETDLDGPSPPRNVASLAAVAVQGGTTRYDLPHPVTVPDQSATMVLLAAREVPGRRLYLFAPDGGVPASARHPFNVARFVNRTGATLERGPLAIFEAGAFLGQGLLEALPDGATATVPFALERALLVESQSTGAVDGNRLLRMLRDQVTVERYRTMRATYTVRSGLDRATQVMVRHRLPAGGQLYRPPPGTERTDDAALVPVAVRARGRSEVEVQTREPFAVTLNFADDNAADAIEAFLREAQPPAALAAVLRSALDLRQQMRDLSLARANLEQQRVDLQRSAEETRENLEAIRRNPGAADLRARLTRRLAELAPQLDGLTRRIVEIDTQLGERRVRLTETLRTLDFDAANPRAAASAAPQP